MLTTLYQFTGGSDSAYPGGTLVLDNGALYGTTPSTIFKIDLSSGVFATVLSFAGTNAYAPSGLISANGLLYGTASGDYGTLFKFDPATGTKTVLYSFRGGSDGELPSAGLLYSNGLLYGSTQPVARALATVFSYDLATGTKNTLYTFKREAGLKGPLVASGSNLFGIATSPRSAPYGAVLRLNAASRAAHFFPFPSATGGYPDASLLHVDGAYYGTTRSSGDGNAGTVFKFVP